MGDKIKKCLYRQGFLGKSVDGLATRKTGYVDDGFLIKEIKITHKKKIVHLR
jgi:hypothetical protein